MAILKLNRKRKNAEQAIEAERRTALRQRLNERLQSLDKKRRAVDDNRDSRRESVYRVGSAVFEPGRERTCRVVDQSYSGLRLELADAETCPDEFALTIPTLRFIGIVRKEWQNETHVGVSILRWSDAA